MLALSRKKNEALVINNNIEITDQRRAGKAGHQCTQGSSRVPQGGLRADSGG